MQISTAIASRNHLVKSSVFRTLPLFVLLILPHFKTAYIDVFPLADDIFNIARIISVFFTIVLYVAEQKRMNKCAGLLLLFEACLFLSTVLNDQSVVPFIGTYALGLGVYLLIDLYSSKAKMIVSVLFVVGEFLVYTNLASMLIFPDGLYVSKLLNYYHNWLLGYKNQFLPFFICFITVAYFRMAVHGHRGRSIALIIAMVISLILADSSTSLIVMLIFIGGMQIAKTRLRFLSEPYFLVAIIIVLFFIIVNVKSLEEIGNIIASLTNRDITFSGRTVIWASALNLVVKNPLFGYGVLSDENHISLIGQAEASSSHNFYIEVLFTGGVVSFIVFCLFVAAMLNKLQQYKGTYASKLFSIALFAIGIAYMTEAYTTPILFVLFAFAANVEQFAKLETTKQNC